MQLCALPHRLARRLAGDETGIDIRQPRDDHSIHRHPVAWTNLEEIAGLDRENRDFGHTAIGIKPPRRLAAQGEQIAGHGAGLLAHDLVEHPARRAGR